MQAWTKNRLSIQPWQRIPQQMAALSLTDEDGMTQAWFVAENGRLTGGAEAVNEVMKYVCWLRPFTFLYHISGFTQLPNHVYRWMANNRYRMPGSTDACAIETKKD